jgi:uncharacterized UPF0146 family protein
MAPDKKESTNYFQENNPNFYIGAENTKQVWNNLKDNIKQIEIRFGEKNKVKIPYFIFDNLSIDKQLDLIYSLSNATVRDHRDLIYEIGCGESLSPISSAAKEKNRTVIAIDSKNKPELSYRAGTISLEIPNPDKQSFAAYFNLDIKNVDTERLAKSKLVYSISPFPNSIENFIDFGTKISEEVIIIANPRQNLDTFKILNKIKTKNVELLINRMNTYQIAELIGTSESAFIDSESAKFGTYVIRAKKTA